MCWEERIDGKDLIRLIRISLGTLVQLFICFDIFLLVASIVVFKVSDSPLCSANIGFLGLWITADNILNFLGKISMLFSRFHKKSLEK